MNTFGINIFKSYFEGITETFDEVTWEEFVSFITSGHIAIADKVFTPLFNASRFKSLDQVITENKNGYFHSKSDDLVVRRTKENVIEIELLILDYDGGMSLDEAKEWFKAYEYVGYTSYNHLADNTTHKFRLIFPLCSPIPVQKTSSEIVVYEELTNAIQQFAPKCDEVVFNSTQAYFWPSAPPKRIVTSLAWSNKGQTLDWKKWAVNETEQNKSEIHRSEAKTHENINKKLDPNQVFKHKNGVVVAKEIQGRIQYVLCPFHVDKKGSEFLIRYRDSGVVLFNCKKCGTFTLPPEKQLDKQYESGDGSVESGIYYGDVWFDHEDRKPMMEFLNKVKKTILSDKGYTPPSVSSSSIRPNYKYKSHVIYLPEGSGKSRLALSFLEEERKQFAKNGHIVMRKPQMIFACKSWKQAEEQYASFLPKMDAIGRKAKISRSFEAYVNKKFNVKILRKPAKNFTTGHIKEEETKAEIKRKNPKLTDRFINLSWQMLGEASYRFSEIALYDDIYIDAQSSTHDNYLFDEPFENPPAIIFTTFAQLRLIKRKRDHIPLHWIIWFDDPDVDELIDIKPAAKIVTNSASEVNLISFEISEIEQKEINGTLYDVRPADTGFGFAFQKHRCIFTTTEKVTLRLLEYTFKNRHEDYLVHGERHRVSGGKITILGTQAVHKKSDALIPLMMRRLTVNLKKGMLLIADGIPADFNHSTNKGRNDLNKQHIVIELSQPHPASIKTICDSLGIDFNIHRDEISKEIMLDKMHQAIGRNSGYRTAGFECVLLVDRNKHEYLLKECSYSFDTLNSVNIDRTEKMSRMDTRTTETATPTVKEIEKFLNNINTYIDDFRKVKPDIQYVLTTIEDQNKQFKYLIRLLIALTTHSKVRFDFTLDDMPQNSHSKKVWELGQWVLNNLLTPNLKQPALEIYKSEFSPIND